MACLIATVEITRRLLTNWSFGLVLKNSASYIKRVCIIVANKKTKVFKLKCSSPVDVKEDRVVPLRVFNVSDNVYNLAPETVVALAKPVIDVTSLETYEENGSVVGQARVMNQHVTGETTERTLPELLQELLEHCTDLTDSETARLKELLYDYQHVVSLTEGDLGTTQMVKHRIETGNVLPIRQQP